MRPIDFNGANDVAPTAAEEQRELDFEVAQSAFELARRGEPVQVEDLAKPRARAAQLCRDARQLVAQSRRLKKDFERWFRPLD